MKLSCEPEGDAIAMTTATETASGENDLCDVTVRKAGEPSMPCGLERPCPQHDRCERCRRLVDPADEELEPTSRLCPMCVANNETRVIL
jgi:hypothetical protein